MSLKYSPFAVKDKNKPKQSKNLTAVAVSRKDEEAATAWTKRDFPTLSWLLYVTTWQALTVFISFHKAMDEGIAERKQKDHHHKDNKFSGITISPCQNNLQLNVYF